MSTSHVSVREAKRHFEQLLQIVEQGARIVITRSGRPPIHLRLMEKTSRTSPPLPSLKEWREAIEVRGSLRQAVVEQRDE